MTRSYRWKLFAACMAAISLLLVLLAGLGFVAFKNYYLSNLEARLVNEANLVADMTSYRQGDGTGIRSYQDICISAARDSASRITIIDADGVVLGDSEASPGQLDNHSSRPEVYSALHGDTGVQIRYSDTLAMDMLYVAVPFNNADKKGAVRLAMPLADLQSIYNHALTGLLGIALLCALLALLLSFALSRYFARPLQSITDAVQDMARGNLKRRINLHSTDELGILAQNFNEMGQHIEASIAEISAVKNRLEAIFSNTVNGIMLIGHDGLLVYANPAAMALLSLEDTFIGRRYTEIIAAYEILAMIDEAVKSKQPVKRTVFLRRRSDRIVELNVVPVVYKDMASQDLLLILNDITALKHLEQVRKDFVANVSHELKTPVATISGFAETLLEEGQESANVEEFTKIIYDEAQRLTNLINGLLTLSRLESDQVLPNIQKVNMNALIADISARMTKLAGLSDIKIVCHLPEQAVWLDSDPELIDPILVNLLDNAIKYSSAGSQIEVGLEDGPDRMVIIVKDNGMGIPAAELPRIFERFYRIDKARSRKTGGSGLGLAIVKHLVENLKGDIEVSSAIGQGSTFRITLFK